MLTHAQLLQLKRWNTPTIYNGWEQITGADSDHDGFNLEEVTDFMPRMGPMIGYAVTVTIQPGNREHKRAHPENWERYRQYVASVPGPKIVVVQDLDKPMLYGAFWGEVMSNFHRAVGCVGTIIDGGIRDVDEMTNAGFKALARRLCVGHASVCPVDWDVEVEVFGRKVQPGRLIHADKHGFLVIPPEDEERLLDAALFMDRNECDTVIAAARDSAGVPTDAFLQDFAEAAARFSENTREQFGAEGEWN